MLTTDRRTLFKATALMGVGAMTMTPVQLAQAGAQPSSPPSPGKTPLAPPDKQAANVKMPVKKKKIGWAIVGLGQLAIEEILPAFGLCDQANLAAFVSGHPDKAKFLAEIYGLPHEKVYGYDDFDRIAKDDTIDVVYIVLPNSMHAEYTIKALQAGKHVLCEKPMATTAAECEQMIKAADAAGKQLGIAYRLHYEPLNIKAAELCASGAIGTIKTISASNCQDTKPPNIRLSAALGGGPVGDVGVYCINGACWITGEQPVAVTAKAHWPKDNPRFAEVPESVSFTLEYPSGVIASCECGFGSSVSRRYRITGDKGFIDMDPAYAYRGLSLRMKSGSEEDGTSQLATLQIEQKNHFTEEMDGFSKAVSEGLNLKTPATMGLADVKTVAAIMEAAATGKKVTI